MPKKAILLALFLLATCIQAATAHPIPDARILLDFEEDGVWAEIHLPLTELEFGFGQKLPGKLVQDSVSVRDAIGKYVVQHISALAPDHRHWTATLQSVNYHTEPSATGTTDIEEAVVQVWLTPPAGASSRQLTLQYDAIVHELVTHKALVSIRRDWQNGVTGSEPEFIGRVSWHSKSFIIDRSAGSNWAGLIASFKLGIHHIAEGTDHLLFLLVLLLPAALHAPSPNSRLKSRISWQGFAGWRTGFKNLFLIVTAFTIGHSLTLALGSLGGLTAPAGPVEVIIAVSILLSAIHAIRPLFPNRETLVAGGFGLIHGLAFAEIIAEFELGPWQSVLTLLGFNLGIEILQLAIVAIVAPVLFVLARTPFYRSIRLGTAMFAGIAALAWALQRGLGLPNPVEPWVNLAAQQSIWLYVALALLAICSLTGPLLSARRLLFQQHRMG